MNDFELIAQWIAENYPYAKKIVEIGIGKSFHTAEFLKEKIPNCELISTDMRELEVPNGIEFYQDDITSPKKSIYQGAELIFSIRPPTELHSFLESISKEVKSDLLIKPLSSEESPKNEKLVNYRGISFYTKKFKEK